MSQRLSASFILRVPFLLPVLWVICIYDYICICICVSFNICLSILLRFEDRFGGSGTPCFAVSQNADKYTTWVSADKQLPCMTKSGTTRLFHAGKGRWLTAREKLAAAGLSVTDEQSAVSGVGQVPWGKDLGWHARVGNGQQTQNVGLVLLAALSTLKLRDGVTLSIEPPSQPKGLAKAAHSTIRFILNFWSPLTS